MAYFFVKLFIIIYQKECKYSFFSFPRNIDELSDLNGYSIIVKIDEFNDYSLPNSDLMIDFL